MIRASPTLEYLAALSAIFDLANGFAEDKSLLTAAFARDLAIEAGLARDERAAVFLAALLRHLGCTAYTHAESALAPDDIHLRFRLIHAESWHISELVAAVSAAGGDGAALGEIGAAPAEIRDDWTREVCGAARLLGEQLRAGPTVVQALDEVFERWDGSGAPRGRRGEEISRVGRVAQVAHVAVVFWLAGRGAIAAEALRKRAGNALDPQLADLAIGHLARLDDLAADPLAARAVEGAELCASTDEIAAAFGDFADLQTPHTRGHSRRVAAIAGEGAARLGLPAAEQREVRLAAHLHDLGNVAVPTSIWTRARPLRPTEQERARSHAYLTERILASAAPLAGVARIAGAHHERLDGSGYYRGVTGDTLGRASRLLAAADVLSAMEEPRPHRPAMRRAEAARELRAMAQRGALDAACVEAVLGEKRTPASDSAAALTARELDVLRKLARGKTNKEIAQDLGISDRTVQHHTIRIYEKLGVDTRAAATLLAVQRGLLDPV
jgi:HD-GYP domain-containing protein (c-di-GMP phosphodiesterase class II)